MLQLVCLSLLAIATAESCFDVGQGYTGKDIKHVADSATPEDCQVKCQNTDGCVAWTHDTRERHKNKPRSYKHKGCWLHHGKGPRWSSPDAVSDLNSAHVQLIQDAMLGMVNPTLVF